MAKKKFRDDYRTKLDKLDAETIAFYRRNPCIAAEEILGIKLTDAQKYVLQGSWNALNSVWCCSRNFGKSFVGAIFIILKAILYENQSIYIVSNVGAQAKETFQKLEEIVRRFGSVSESCGSLLDIAEKETVKSPTNKTGFSHPPEGHYVKFYNGSEIRTLNGVPERNRGHRATLVFFDEAAFCTEELIAACEPFTTQSSEFRTSTDSEYDPNLNPAKVPNQIIYASSQNGVEQLFYKKYKKFAKAFFAGDRNYFVCDMTCDLAIKVYIDGKLYPPLLKQEKVDAMMKSDPERGMREYYNKPTLDGGSNQIVKWGVIRRNETFYIPQVTARPDYKYALAFDPARTGDNSILSVMELYEDPKLGWCGDIVNCINFVDTISKNGYKLDSNRQIKELRNTILRYGGDTVNYENLDCLLVDQGSGGGGTSTYADGLLNEWEDDSGYSHHGLIDSKHEIYEGYKNLYPKAVDKLRLISPRKLRTQMVEEFIELVHLGVIHFPYMYSGQDYIQTLSEVAKNETFSSYELSVEEKLALTQIDLMKSEITSIFKSTNADKTSVSYSLPKEKENRMHDDRFYTIILLAHRLMELRRAKVIKPTTNFENIQFQFRAPVMRRR